MNGTHDYVDGLSRGTLVSTVVMDSSGLYIQRSGLEEAELTKVKYLKSIRAQHK